MSLVRWTCHPYPIFLPSEKIQGFNRPRDQDILHAARQPEGYQVLTDAIGGVGAHTLTLLPNQSSISNITSFIRASDRLLGV